jgi:hypothetical protein
MVGEHRQQPFPELGPEALGIQVIDRGDAQSGVELVGDLVPAP